MKTSIQHKQLMTVAYPCDRFSVSESGWNIMTQTEGQNN